MSEQQKSLQQIMDFRLEKLQKLKDAGVNPYPHQFKPTHSSQEILGNYETLENKTVVVAGRIMALRKMGKASFTHIMDGAGRIQAYIRRDDIGEDQYNHFKLLDIGDFIGIEGYVFTTKMGEISIHADKITVLAKSIRPLPVVKEKDGETFDAFSDKEQRYRNRHLDLIVNPEVRETFIKRTKIINAIRSYLDGRDFLEVETPVLQPLYGGANARPFVTHHNSLDQTFYLRIADELYLKRLIIGGFEKVYEIGKDFRNEGMDRSHNPEFTMLEYYEAYADYTDTMALIEDMIQTVAKGVDATQITWGDMEIDLSKPFAKKPYFELLKEATGRDLSKASLEELKTIFDELKIEIPANVNVPQMLGTLMDDLVEPSLIQPTFVIDYPKEVSPLAKLHRNGDESLVERFELIIGGSEFANSFSELNDPIDQRQRLEAQAALREAGDEEAQPVDENFLQAMECGMPPTGGVGLGVDRLVMLLTGNRWIRDVLLFPALRSE
ncbi:MAG: lysine--tRNA ligase [Candidatus Marinimicrobia bacterium]|jgi:lysyl-tRNA synthetase class 2|nr:lysine--tRNA ligase [Candidatus Neomarinimicrobiota bacterium]MBT3692297.1 lysine--tRNA ligase [Candidatus Neomarinimicrobiota bacterium]MBT3732417.1 lysine--tRNA ligase [Candidatus Neomarinimicrobiota bacterium]MBT4144593.1 lysine--tRNA ligase [Candidatus Neomarinimicrobiota bacterium]MBT4990445.1 lysine--tRNA ligase [Candidatus Neomarinimicrobiota bacterium]